MPFGLYMWEARSMLEGTGYKNIDKAEQKILKRNGNRERKPDVEMIKKLNAAFGGGS